MQYKQITNPSFTVLMLEVQVLLKAGWEIDENNYPMAHFVYYEVNLVKDEHAEAIADAFSEQPTSVNKSFPDGEIFDKPVVKKAGRPPQNKAAQ